MYVGDDEALEAATRPNTRALTMCRVGIGIAALGLLLGNKSIRNVGAITAVGGFLAI